jgi:hypothetical protein
VKDPPTCCSTPMLTMPYPESVVFTPPTCCRTLPPLLPAWDPTTSMAAFPLVRPSSSREMYTWGAAAGEGKFHKEDVGCDERKTLE